LALSKTNGGQTVSIPGKVERMYGIECPTIDLAIVRSPNQTCTDYHVAAQYLLLKIGIWENPCQ
jgi:hypothetical protein